VEKSVYSHSSQNEKGSHVFHGEGLLLTPLFTPHLLILQVSFILREGVTAHTYVDTILCNNGCELKPSVSPLFTACPDHNERTCQFPHTVFGENESRLKEVMFRNRRLEIQRNLILDLRNTE